MYFRMEFQSRIPLPKFSVCIGKSLKHSTRQTTVMHQKNISKYPGNFLQFLLEAWSDKEYSNRRIETIDDLRQKEFS